MTFIVLPAYTFINVFMGTILSFYLYKNNESSQILHTGPLKSFFEKIYKCSPFTIFLKRKCQTDEATDVSY